jgi:hypothetical protein
MKKIVAPNSGHCYHGVYAATDEGDETSVSPESLQAYLGAVGREHVAWVMFSHEWAKSRVFPGDVVKWIDDAKAAPYIRLMLRSSTDQYVCEPVFTLKNILAGMFDDDLKAWGAAASAKGVPLICEWGTEMNGAWFPWNAIHNGGETGAGLFQDAYRHLITAVRDGGGRDVTWVFHVNHESNPAEDWNTVQSYDPGPDFTDWIGVSLYGAQFPNEPQKPIFSKRYARVRPELTSLPGNRPVMISEFGCTKTDADPTSADVGEWAKDALSSIIAAKKRWPELRGFSWWNEGWKNGDGKSPTEMRVQKLKPLQDVFSTQLKENERRLVECPIVAAR